MQTVQAWAAPWSYRKDVQPRLFARKKCRPGDPLVAQKVQAIVELYYRIARLKKPAGLFQQVAGRPEATWLRGKSIRLVHPLSVKSVSRDDFYRE